MKSVIYEFDPVIYPFKLLVTKKFDKEEMKEKYRAVNAESKIVPITGQPPTNKFVGLTQANAHAEQAQADQPQ